MGIKEKIMQLPQPLIDRLLSLPHGATADDFSEEEQAQLRAAFGPDWPAELGLRRV